MIIDAHAHLDPRLLDADAYVSRMDRAGIDRVALIPTMNDPLPETPHALLAAMRRVMSSTALRPLALGVHRALLTPEGDLRLAGRVIQIYDRPDNGAVADAIRRYPDRFLGWIFLNPRNNPLVLDELERWRATPGMIGVKLHPHWHDYRVDQLFPLLTRVEELGLPVLIHLGFGRRGDYRTLAERFPRLRIIAAHAGFPYYGDLWRFARNQPRTNQNLFIDLSSPYIDEALARDAVRALGPERCLYGTDSPYGFHDADGAYDYGHIKGWVERLPLGSRDLDRVFAENFLELIERPPS